MKFNQCLYSESNLKDLYASTVQSFPRTTLRQHAIDPIKITELKWTPFVGVNTLFLKGLAQSNGKEYNPIMLFKGVSYHKNKDDSNWLEITANDGQNYILEKLSYEHEILLRCNCLDFFWRFNFTDKKDESLYGRVRKKYEAKFTPGSSNPLELPGMCKHLIKLAYALNHSGVLEG